MPTEEDLDLTPPPFEDHESLFVQDESIPEEHRVIKLTGELYDELITTRWGTPLNGDTPWVILFLLPDQVDNRRAMVNYKNLARSYKGKVRFGYVVKDEEELLSATFETKQLPYTIFIKDGIAYWYRDFAYENVMRNYIDNEGYHKSTTKFKQPGLFFPLHLYAYSYPRKFLKYHYRGSVETRARIWLYQFNKNYDYQFNMPKVDKVVNITYWTLFNIVCLLPLIMSWCCCGKKRQVRIDQRGPVTSTS